MCGRMPEGQARGTQGPGNRISIATGRSTVGPPLAPDRDPTKAPPGTSAALGQAPGGRFRWSKAPGGRPRHNGRQLYGYFPEKHIRRSLRARRHGDPRAGRSPPADASARRSSTSRSPVGPNLPAASVEADSGMESCRDFPKTGPAAPLPSPSRPIPEPAIAPQPMPGCAAHPPAGSRPGRACRRRQLRQTVAWGRVALSRKARSAPSPPSPSWPTPEPASTPSRCQRAPLIHQPQLPTGPNLPAAPIEADSCMGS